VLFAGQATPGIATVEGLGTPRRWEERESVGLSGALVYFHGLKLAHFSVRVQLFSEQDWQDWYAFKPLVDKPPIGKRQRPLDIVHPLTEGANIKAVVVEDVLHPEQVDDGVWELSIKLIEYRKPHLVLAKAEGAKATPADPEDAEIEANSRELQALADEVIP